MPQVRSFRRRGLPLEGSNAALIDDLNHLKLSAPYASATTIEIFTRQHLRCVHGFGARWRVGSTTRPTSASLQTGALNRSPAGDNHGSPRCSRAASRGIFSPASAATSSSIRPSFRSNAQPTGCCMLQFTAAGQTRPGGNRHRRPSRSG